IFSTNVSEEVIVAAEKAYKTFAEAVPSLNIIFQTYFEKVFAYERIVNLPVKAIGLDFVHGDSLSLLQEHGFPKDKVLAAGIIDERNDWRAHLGEKLPLLETLKRFVQDEQLIVQPSSSLLHVLVTKIREQKIDTVMLHGLSFADEKLQEIVTLTKGLKEGRTAIATEIDIVEEALHELKEKYR